MARVATGSLPVGVLLSVFLVLAPACDGVEWRGGGSSTETGGAASAGEGAGPGATGAAEGEGALRVTIRGAREAEQGEPVSLVAEVEGAPPGELVYDWVLDGRGSLMSRAGKPSHVTVIGSEAGVLTVTVSVKKDDAVLAVESVDLRIHR